VAYARGKHARAMCDICGFEVKYTSLKPQWDGFRACPTCWTPRHPQDFPRIVLTDPEALRDPRPDNDQEAGCGLVTATSDPYIGGAICGMLAFGSVGTVTVSV
jgi:hypothetical protein